MSPRVLPPRDLHELGARAAALEGTRIDLLEQRFSSTSTGPMVHRKGKAGQLLERALGAHAGSASAPDFPTLGVELKTLPLDRRGRPIESTFVCSLSLRAVDRAEWCSSSVRQKLLHVLFVPIVMAREGVLDRKVGRPFFWRPSEEQESILRADFDDLIGMIALGHIEGVTARLGRWLQIRPKAAHGNVRTRAYGLDDEPISTIPRGFYLRARFTAMLLEEQARGELTSTLSRRT